MPPNLYEPPKKRRWLQFSLRSFLVGVLVVAAFFAGRTSSIHRAEKAEREKAELADQVAKVFGHNLYSPEYAEQVKRRVERLTDASGRMNQVRSFELDEFFETIGVEIGRMPSVLTGHDKPLEVFILSHRHRLCIDRKGLNVERAYVEEFTLAERLTDGWVFIPETQ